MTFNGRMGDLVSHVIVVGSPKCGQKENFPSIVANRIVVRSTPAETIEALGLGNWSLTCSKWGYKISKLKEIFRNQN